MKIGRWELFLSKAIDKRKGITIMVTIVSAYQKGFTGIHSKISGGPLYQNILQIVNSASISAVTEKCIKDLLNLSKDTDDIRAAITTAVKNGRFIGSEWCALSRRDTWAACDAYHLTEKAWAEAAHKYLPCDFYIKFCIGITGAIIMMVSYHLCGQK